MTAPTEMEMVDLMLRTLEAIPCWWCGHGCGRHFAHRGPCADCWRDGRPEDDLRQVCGVTLCPAFVPDDDAIRSLEALIALSGGPIADGDRVEVTAYEVTS